MEIIDNSYLNYVEIVMYELTEHLTINQSVWLSLYIDRLTLGANCLFPFSTADKRRSKNLSSGNLTVDTDAIEPCDHHLDCLPGQSASYMDRNSTR